MSRAVRILPKVAGAFRLSPGFIRLTKFRTFVASTRSWSTLRPARPMSRKIPRSMFL